MNVTLFPNKPHRIPISGATPADVAFVRGEIDLLFNLFISAVQARVENLAENLPIGSLTKDVRRGWFDVLTDLKSDMDGTLGKIEDADA